jgi:hypothetical protein
MHHIAGKKDVGKPVIVDVADSRATTIVEIDIIKYVELCVIEEGILEIYAGLVFVEAGKEPGIAVVMGASGTGKQADGEETERRCYNQAKTMGHNGHFKKKVPSQ